MRRSSRGRVVIAVVLVTGSLLTGAPAASATTEVTATLAFIGTMTTGNLGFACVGGGSTVDTSKCPVIGNSSPITDPVLDTSINAPIGGNTRAFTFATTVCVGAGTRVSDAPTTATPLGPACSIVLAGTITGTCDLAYLNYGGTITVSSATAGADAEPTTVNLVGRAVLKFGAAPAAAFFIGYGIGYLLRPLIYGKAATMAPPWTTLPGTALGNNCATKTLTEITLAGEFSMALVGA